MGNVVISQYRPITQLAREASYHVYLAQSLTRPSDKVVVKMFDSVHLSSRTEQEQFLSNAEAFSLRLKHPYILPVLDAGIEDERPYIVSAYAPNASLQDRLSSLHRFSAPLAIRVLTQVGHALSYAHRRNILHGRIKPENILFGSEGDALLADFYLPGIVKQFGPYDKPGIRSALYMAPESFSGRVTRQSDQYSLACVAYEVFTGRPPFNARAYSSMRQKHALEQPEPLTSLVPDLPEYIEIAVLKALSKNPGNRFDYVSTFIDALNLDIIEGLQTDRDYLQPQKITPKFDFSVPIHPVNATVSHVQPQVGQAEKDHPAIASEVVEPEVAVAPVVQQVENSTTDSLPLPEEKLASMGQAEQEPSLASLILEDNVVRTEDNLPTNIAAPSYVTSLRQRKLSLRTAIAAGIVCLVVLGTVFTLMRGPSPPQQPLVTQSHKMATIAATPHISLTSQPSVATTRAVMRTQAPKAVVNLFNSGFEVPDIGLHEHVFDPDGTGWQVMDDGGKGFGIASNGSSFLKGNPDAPQGVQVGFLRKQVAISQDITMPAGAYTISFDAAQRANNDSVQDILVLVDGNPVGSFTPGSRHYRLYSTDSFTVTSGTHTIQLVGLDSNGGDNAVLIDNITIM